MVWCGQALSDELNQVPPELGILKVKLFQLVPVYGQKPAFGSCDRCLSPAAVAGEKGNLAEQCSSVDLDIDLIEQDGACLKIVKAISQVTFPKKDLPGEERALASVWMKLTGMHPRNGRSSQFLDLPARFSDAVNVHGKLDGILDHIWPKADGCGRYDSQDITGVREEPQTDDGS